jgi:hypothetical protein
VVGRSADAALGIRLTEVVAVKLSLREQIAASP